MAIAIRCILPVCVLLCLTLRAEKLQVHLKGETLSLAGSQLHFISGRPLEQMRNGSAVAFDFQLVISDETRSVLRRNFERFVVSYDLWEEKFSVTRMRSGRSSASRLTAASVEAWCLDSFVLPAAGIPEDKPIFLRLEVRAQEGRRPTIIEDDQSWSIAALIELFSRAAKPHDPQQWRLDTGPLRLRDLGKANNRNGS